MNKEMLKRELIRVILNSWNFCGNAREAAYDVFYDFGVPYDEDLYFEAVEAAAEKWNKMSEEAKRK